MAARKGNWNDDYWLMVLQIYLTNPVGVKPMYSRAVVDLSMEIHVHPSTIFARECAIANLETPRLERIWQTYSNRPRKLTRAVRLLRQMFGYGNAGEFYEGVEVNESFEKDFKPVNDSTNITPVMLIIILDLYFRLTPITMVAETPEVRELAKKLHIDESALVEILDVYQHCDPYLNRKDVTTSRFLSPCIAVWERYGNGETAILASFAEQLMDYFR